MEDDFEPARELCPDGGCIGLVGPDGRCKVCGTVSASVISDPRHRGMRSPGGSADDPSLGSGDELDEERELCPDDACIGIIGPDGRCKECGAKGSGARGSAAAASGYSASEAEPDSVANGGADLDEEDDRQLCPNGACIGLIGADGRCKVCGTPAASPAS